MVFDNDRLFYDALMLGMRHKDRPLGPPEVKYGARDVIYEEALAEAMMGDGEFWASWSNDQHIRIVEAVRIAMSLIGQSDTQCMRVIRNAVLAECEKYADWRARK